MSDRKGNFLRQKELSFFFSEKRRLDNDDNPEESNEKHCDFVSFV